MLEVYHPPNSVKKFRNEAPNVNVQIIFRTHTRCL